MSDHNNAIETLLRSRKELIHDIAESGAQGGIGSNNLFWLHILKRTEVYYIRVS